MEKKEVILKKLKNTYCRLQPSVISGVGVFAIMDIPQGINPFQGAQEPEWIEFNVEELKNLDKEIKKMIDDFYVIEKDGGVYIPECTLDNMDVSFYVNHSANPNLKKIDFYKFGFLRTLKGINALRNIPYCKNSDSRNH